jgi:DNA-binding transcriptional LysR family regulator
MAAPSPTPGPPELPHLAAFARAAELGSFTAAASTLGISRAALSRRSANNPP